MKKVRDIFVTAIELPPGKRREDYLRETCRGNTALYSQVQDLLNQTGSTAGFLETPAVESLLEEEVKFREPSADLLREGEVFASYTIRKLIGHGGCGLVYLAEQEFPIKRSVAIKVLRSNLKNERIVAGFEAERQVLAWMNHPHIASIIDAGELDQGRPYFIMELVDGVSIIKFCAEARFSLDQRLDLFIKVCRAIHYAHQKGVIHRDIKPTNILVRFQDGEAFPKVIDFGIAKAIEGVFPDEKDAGAFPRFMGTPAYASPEQIQMRSQDIDTRTDIYSLGVVLYELLTGRTPFEHEDSVEDRYEAVISHLPVKPSLARLRNKGADSIDPDFNRAEFKRIREDLDAIILKCLEKDRNQRYETVNSLIQDIQRHRQQLPILAAPTSWWLQSIKFYRRNTAAVLAGLVMVVSMIAIGIISVNRTVESERSNQAKALLYDAAKAAELREFEQRRLAEARSREAAQRAYISDMNLAQQSLMMNHLGRIRSLLAVDSGDDHLLWLRNWEWHYYHDQSRNLAVFQWPLQEERLRLLASGMQGRLLASLAGPNVIHVWSAEDGEQLHRIEFQDMFVEQMFFSKNGFLVKGRSWRSDRVVGFKVPEFEKQFDVRVEGLINLFPNAAEDGFVTGLTHEGSLVRLDWIGGEITHSGTLELSREERIRLVTSDSGLKRFAALYGSRRVRLMDAGTGRSRRVDLELPCDVSDMGLSSSGRLLALAPRFTGVETDILLVDTETGTIASRLTGHSSWVPTLTFFKNQNRLVTGGADQTIRIWDADAKRQEQMIKGNLSEVNVVAVDSEGRWLFSGGKDGSIMKWDLEEDLEIQPYEILDQKVESFRFFQRGHDMVFQSEGMRMWYWSGDPAQPPKPIASWNHGVFGWVLGPEGRKVYAYGPSEEISIMDIGTGQIESKRLPTGQPYQIIGFGQQGEAILLPVGTGVVEFRNRNDFSLLKTVTLPSNANQARGAPFRRMAPVFHAPTGSLYLQDDPSHVIRYDLDNGRIVSRMDLGENHLSSFMVSRSGDRLAASFGDGIAHVYRTDTGRLEHVLRGHLLGVHGIGFSLDESRIVSSSHGREALKIWDSDTGLEVSTLGGEGSVFFQPTFSPDSQLLVSMSLEKGLHIWRAPGFVPAD